MTDAGDEVAFPYRQVRDVSPKKWGSPERPLVMTGWQLAFGGLLLAPRAATPNDTPSTASLA